jgi:hypothetical protein
MEKVFDVPKNVVGPELTEIFLATGGEGRGWGGGRRN